jgi:fructuronate reductase
MGRRFQPSRGFSGLSVVSMVIVPGGRAHTGTRFVPDVGVFERAKLQMLNGTHMLLAYAGALAGLDTVAAAASDPALGALAARFMRLEQGADVTLGEAELDEYAFELMRRFRNAAIAHQGGACRA